MPELVFIGPSGAGKSRIGRRVARALGVPIADTDKMVVAEFGPIAEIFERDGEPRFRELERAAVERALNEPAEGALTPGRHCAYCARRPICPRAQPEPTD